MKILEKWNKYANYGIVKSYQYFGCNVSEKDNRIEYTQQINHVFTYLHTN